MSAAPDLAGRRMASSLARVRPLLPSCLAGDDALDRVGEAAAAIPAFMADFFGFERRLGGGGGGVDCAMNLTPDGARMLAGRHAVPPPPELREGPWRRLADFYRAWGDTRRPAYVDAPSTWLEFDTERGAEAPNLLFGYWPRAAAAERPVGWLLDEIIPMLLARPVSPGLRASIERCFAAAPEGTDDFQVGLMFTRPVQAVRICLFDLPREGVAAYLKDVGWSGDAGGLEAWVDELAPFADIVGLHLDVGEAVYPHIGVEPAFSAGCWTRQPHREPRWAGQFDVLGRRGLVTPEERQALLDWVGHQRIADERGDYLLMRGLSHLKVVLRPGGPPLAKAYFGIAHRAMEATAAHAA